MTVAESHAARGFAGSTAVVYALGGNSFEAALVRRTRAARTRRSAPTGSRLDRRRRLRRGAGRARPYHAGPGAGHDRASRHQAALRGLRAECDRVKRVLTVDLTADVVLTLPSGPARIPVTRAQFEAMIRPTVQATVDLLLRAVRSADLTPTDLDGVLLAGGSTRVPLVTELIGAAFPVPVEVEPDAQLTAATGAAMAACQVVSPRPRQAAPAAFRPGQRRRTGHHPGLAPPAPRHHRPGRSATAAPVRVLPLDLPKPPRLALARSRGREG
ncbi:Hsp70 family protein [Micromonospora sp. M12]